MERFSLDSLAVVPTTVHAIQSKIASFLLTCILAQ
jgi:hypothetical protein